MERGYRYCGSRCAVANIVDCIMSKKVQLAPCSCRGLGASCRWDLQGSGHMQVDGAWLSATPCCTQLHVFLKGAVACLSLSANPRHAGAMHGVAMLNFPPAGWGLLPPHLPANPRAGHLRCSSTPLLQSQKDVSPTTLLDHPQPITAHNNSYIIGRALIQNVETLASLIC